jgi:hypothetical protein
VLQGADKAGTSWRHVTEVTFHPRHSALMVPRAAHTLVRRSAEMVARSVASSRSAGTGRVTGSGKGARSPAMSAQDTAVQQQSPFSLIQVTAPAPHSSCDRLFLSLPPPASLPPRVCATEAKWRAQ